jgi:hypothetical protein
MNVKTFYFATIDIPYTFYCNIFMKTNCVVFEYIKNPVSMNIGTG